MQNLTLVEISSFKFFHLKDAQKAITGLPRTFMEGQSKLYNFVIFFQSECTNRFNFCILPLNFAVFWIKDIKVSSVRRISSSILCLAKNVINFWKNPHVFVTPKFLNFRIQKDETVL